MNNCPHCNRVLLSKASARCNWCGAEIQDSAYLEQAQVEREAYFAHQREHDAISLSRIDAINMNVSDQWSSGIPYSPSLAKTRQQRLTEAAILRATAEAAQVQAQSSQQTPYSQQPPPAPAATVRQDDKSGNVYANTGEQSAEPETKPEGRFGHLEF